MTVLVVDDQLSVLGGIRSGVHFEELGIERVFYAASTEEALEILRENTVDIMLSDIEMPGENGLMLNRRAQQLFPKLLRILLTSHAEFSYAQESIKLGCFDYLLQPAPYEEIEECLRRALQELHERRKKEQLYQYGQLLKTNETELMDHVALKLFSRIPEDVDSSIEFLNQMGYPINREKQIQVAIINAGNFKSSETPLYSEKAIHKGISNALKNAGITYPILALTTLNRYKQFALILFSATQEDVELTPEQYSGFYKMLCKELPEEMLTCYVGQRIRCGQVREDIRRIHDIFIDENISNETGVFLQYGWDTPSEAVTNLSESVERWKNLLAAGQKRMLEREIEAFMKSTVDSSKRKHKALCELHQQLTHIFFGYFYDNNAEVGDLFSNEYSYNDYMDSFADTDSLRRAVRYMLDMVDVMQKNNLPKSDVERAKSYIAENIADPITVKDVAEHVNLSAEYFTKLFKRETGCNIKEYIMQSKVDAAKEMLEHSNMSVGMVALELGYSNFSHFTQIFKKYENMTPSEYRSKVLSGE